MRELLTQNGFWLVAGGVFVGAFALGWLVGHYRSASRSGRRLASEETRRAEAAREAELLRGQLAETGAANRDLRSELEGERRARAVAETRLEEAARSLEEQREQFEQARKRLEATFTALSHNALDQNSRMFEERAKRTLETVLEKAKGDLGTRQEAIRSLVAPLTEGIERYQTRLREIEEARDKAYGSLEEHLRALGSAQEQLHRETTGLKLALRGHGARGRWGELTLRRVAELSGMTEHCDFDQQTTVEGEGRQRPDMLVKLPAGRVIVVDAKAPMEAYLDAVEATDERTRADALQRHARNVRDHLKALSLRGYWEQFESTPELVVMFIPGESFFSAAVEADPKLIEFGAKNRVVVATPTTLIALLRAVEFGWRQEQIAESAKEISRIGQELHKRLRTFAGHMTRVGKSLDNAVSGYNAAVGSLERSVMPAARRFRDLGAGDGQPIDEIGVVDAQARRLTDTQLVEDEEGES